MTGHKAFLLLGFLALALLLASEVAANDLAEAETSTDKTNELEEEEEVKHPNHREHDGYVGRGGYGYGGYGGRGDYGYGGYGGQGGYGYGRRGWYGGRCRFGCCHRHHHGCKRCCRYAGEAVQTDATIEPQA